MTPTAISIAIFMVAVSAAVFVWFQGSLTAASAKRMMGMMTRLGLNLGTAPISDPRTKAIMKEARQRCARCPREDFCDRWLAGDVEGDNAFCLNAPTFRVLAGTSGSTA